MSTKDLSLKQVIELAITTEQLGARHYADLAKRFADEKAVAEVFRQLAKDEVAHEATFKKLLAHVAEAKVLTPNDDGYYLLRAAASSQFFDPRKAEDLSAIQTPQDALVYAMELEKSTLLYYHSLKDVLDSGPELDAIIAEERSHVTALVRVMVSEARFRGLGDPW